LNYDELLLFPWLGPQKEQRPLETRPRGSENRSSHYQLITIKLPVLFFQKYGSTDWYIGRRSFKIHAEITACLLPTFAPSKAIRKGALNVV
jgi:hypothetical protein